MRYLILASRCHSVPIAKPPCAVLPLCWGHCLNVSIHCDADICVSHQLFRCRHVCAVRIHDCSERMTERVPADSFGNLCSCCCRSDVLFHSLLFVPCNFHHQVRLGSVHTYARGAIERYAACAYPLSFGTPSPEEVPLSSLATIRVSQREHSVGSRCVIHKECGLRTDVILFVLVQ